MAYPNVQPQPSFPSVERDIPAKTQHTERFVVYNWLKVPQRFTATPFGSSPRSIAACTSASAISGVGAGVVCRARTASQ